MQFKMILGHHNDCIGVDGVYLEYVKFPMEVDGSFGTITITTEHDLEAWAEDRFDGDYEIITLDTAQAAELEEV